MRNKLNGDSKMGLIKYTCPCCGYKTLEEKPTGTFQICEICFWEDDSVQFSDPDYEGGANEVSLRLAQANFLKFGACDEGSLQFVRNVNESDVKNINFKLVKETDYSSFVSEE